MANNYVTHRIDFLFKGDAPEIFTQSPFFCDEDFATVLVDEFEWTAADILSLFESDLPDDEYELDKLVSDSTHWLTKLADQGCVEVSVATLFTCDKPRPLDHGVDWECTRLIDGVMYKASLDDVSSLFKPLT